MKRIPLIAALLSLALHASAQTLRTPLTRGLADALYVKLSGNNALVGNTTITGNLSVTGTCTGCGSGGTVTSVGNGTIGGLFSASWATATTTPALSFNFAAAAANCLIAGPTSGGNAVPTCRAFVTADLASAVAPVANGGTGRSTLTANYVLLGNTTTAVQMIAPGTSGNVLTSDGTTWASSTPASVSAPFSDATAIVKNASDATKLIKLDPSGVTTGNTVSLKMTGTAANPTLYLSTDGSNSSPLIKLGSAGGVEGLIWARAGAALDFGAGGGAHDMMEMNNTLGLLLTTGAPGIGWTGSSTVGSANRTQIFEGAAGIINVATTSNNTAGWIVDAGECFVASDQTNATTTLASTTCSVTVKTGRKYSGVCELFLSDSVAADGAKMDFGGGTATSTNFRAQVTAFDSALNLSTQLTSLTGVASASTFTGAGAFEVHFGFEPSSNGTFIPQFAQVAHTAGTLTLARGSHCTVKDTP